MENYDIISIGDSTVDLFLEVDPNDAETSCNVDLEKCVVCFDFGSKVPVSRLTRVAAVGNAANNAIGSSRLGFKTAIYTVIGSDQTSQEIKQILENEGVDTQFVVMESGKQANLSVVINYNAERTIFVHHESRNYNLPVFPQTKWVYYTSVAKGHEILHTQIPDYIKKSEAKLAFNPGSYQLREGVEALKPELEVVEVLILNREEAQMLVEVENEDFKGMINRLRALGPKTVVITDGRNGSYASFDGREFWHVGIPEESPVIEMTGAGDAYSIAFLAALILEKDLAEAMIWGTMNATSVIQHIGAREGLLTKMQMEEFVGKYGSEVKPKMI